MREESCQTLRAERVLCGSAAADWVSMLLLLFLPLSFFVSSSYSSPLGPVVANAIQEENEKIPDSGCRALM